MIGGAVVGAAIGGPTMRWRAEYLHLPTSSRILFTVSVGSREEFGSAAEAMAKRAASKWIEQTGIGSECVMLGVAELTDKMSVRVPTSRPIDDMGDDC